MSKQNFDNKSDYCPNLTLEEFKIEISSEKIVWIYPICFWFFHIICCVKILQMYLKLLRLQNVQNKM